jgi:hypothetical protein
VVLHAVLREKSAAMVLASIRRRIQKTAGGVISPAIYLWGRVKVERASALPQSMSTAGQSTACPRVQPAATPLPANTVARAIVAAAAGVAPRVTNAVVIPAVPPSRVAAATFVAMQASNAAVTIAVHRGKVAAVAVVVLWVPVAVTLDVVRLRVAAHVQTVRTGAVKLQHRRA